MARTPLQRREEALYSDFFRDFTENPVSLDLARKTNEEAVKESIINLILTDKGERPYQPNLGCSIREMLFDLVTPDTLLVSREIIIETINLYEPRANIIGVDVTSSIDDNALDVTIVFNLINSEEDIILTTTITRVK